MARGEVRTKDGQDDYADAVRVRVRSDHGRQGEGLPRDTQQLSTRGEMSLVDKLISVF